MFIHRCLIGFINEDVISFSHFFDFGLHHSVVVEKPVVGVLGLANGKLQLFFNLFLGNNFCTLDVIFSFKACSLASSIYSSTSSSSSESPDFYY